MTGFGRSLATLVGAAALAAASVATPASAQDRVTVVMRSGEAATGAFEDLNNGTIYVRESLNSQRRLPLGGVLVMDFAGNGQNLPEAEQRDARGDDHLLVMRSGSRSRGRLLNIEGGEGSSKPDEPRIISFRTVDGEDRRVRPGEVARLYMGRYPATEKPTTLPAPVPPAAEAGPGVRVEANRQWTSTGIYVQTGQVVRFAASGQIWLSTDNGDTAAPAGAQSGRSAPGAPIPGSLAGALIGRIGNGMPFGIGNQTELRMPGTGELQLGINDGDVNDNRGQFRVEVTPQATGGRPRR
jgi:hypothetical protein